jgi:hypothetical protein
MEIIFGGIRHAKQEVASVSHDGSAAIKPMNKSVSIILLVAGVILLIFGLNASDSVASSVSEAVSGTPTDRSMWLIVSGAVGIALGGFGLFASRRG